MLVKDETFLSELNFDCLLHLFKYLDAYDLLVLQSFNERLKSLVSYVNQKDKNPLLEDKTLIYWLLCDENSVAANIAYFEHLLMCIGQAIHGLDLSLFYCVMLDNNEAILKSKETLVRTFDVVKKCCTQGEFNCLRLKNFSFLLKIPLDNYEAVFKRLKTLKLIDVFIRERDLEKMFTFSTGLKRIKIKNLKFSGKCLASLNRGLTEISLILSPEYNTIVIDYFVEFLERYDQLQRVSFTESVFRLFPMKSLMHLQLKKFSVKVTDPPTNMRINEDLFYLEKMSELKHLRLQSYEIDTMTITILINFSNLETLKLEHCLEFDIDDDLFRLLAKHLPCLKEFHYLPVTSTVTTKGYCEFISFACKLEVFISYFYMMNPEFYMQIVEIRAQSKNEGNWTALVLKPYNGFIILPELAVLIAKYHHIVDVALCPARY